MSTPVWQQRVGASPAKLALVSVLAIAFAHVIWGNTEQEKPQTVDRVATRPRKSVEKVPATKAKLDSRQESRWPEIPVVEACQTDLFAKPEWYLSTRHESALAVRSPLQTLEDLQKQEPKIIVVSDYERVATIGAKDYREGDVVNGLMISEITSDGILFTEIHQ